MQKKYFLATALVAGAFALPAFAGTEVTPVAAPAPAAKPTPAAECPLTGSVMAGYESNYAYRGLIAGSDMDDNGYFSFGASLGYKTANGIQLFAEAVQRWDTGFGDHSTVTGGLSYEIAPQLTASFGYNYQDNGMPGFAAAADGQDYTQEVFVGLSYEATEALRFWIQGIYDFDALEGWYIGAGVSYTQKLSDRVSLVGTIDTAYTADYWVDDSGWNHIAATLELPIQTCCRLTITPFVSYIQTLDLAEDISDNTNDFYGVDVFRDNGFSGGVRATVSF